MPVTRTRMTTQAAGPPEAQGEAASTRRPLVGPGLRLANVLLLVASSLGGLACSASALPTFPNIEYAGVGYNVVLGNPAAESTDPGWQTNPIILLTYDQGTTYDNKYAVPDFLNVLDAPSCSYAGTSSSMTDASSYQSTLQKNIDVSGSGSYGLLSASFSASDDYQSMFKGGQTGTSAYVGTTAVCSSYKASWNSFSFHPNFTSNFQAAVAGLGTSVPYLDFVQAFGTHYPTALTMGGSSFYYSTFDQSSINSMQESSVDITAAASVDFFVHAGADMNNSQHSQDWQTYNSLKKSSTAHGIPYPAPPCGGSMCSDTSTWFNAVEALDGTGPGPSPLDMKLADVYSLLTPQFFPEDPNIITKQTALKGFLNTQYCALVPGCGVPVPSSPSVSPSPSASPSPLAPWPERGHDQRRTGQSPNAGPTGSVGVAWSFTAGGTIESHSTISADGTVYFGCDDNNVYAVNGATGALVWKYPTGNSVQSAPALWGTSVFVGSNDNTLYALSAATGALLWTFDGGNDIISSPTVVNGIVYFGSCDNYVYALDAVSGQQVWYYESGYDIYSSPAVSTSGILYIGSNDDSFYALNASTGAFMWSYETGGDVSSSPVIGLDGTVYVASQDGNMYAFDGPTGGVLWTFATGAATVASPAIGPDGTMYYGAGNGNMNANTPSGGLAWWAPVSTGGDWSSPAIDSTGTLFVGSADSNLYALDSATGAVLWKVTVADNIGSSPSIGNNGMLYAAADSTLYAFAGK